MEQINLKSVITQYPVCLSDDKKLKAILLDLYPNGSKGLIHVLCTIQMAGITSEMQSKGAADELDLCRYRRILQENYGLMGKMVESGLALWQSALIEPKPEPEKKAPAAPRKKKKATESDDLTHIHSYTDTVVPPTCAEQGYTLHSCACGYEYKDNYKPKLPHTYVEVETVAPTCDSDGAQKMRCKNCGVEKIVTLPKREHEFGNWEVTTPATCETEGAEARTCKLCGYTETRTVPAEQHDFSDWIEKTHADCTHGGTETRFCRKCNFTETRKIKALGHAWNRWHPSAEKEKTAERYCSRCGKMEEEPFDYETAEKQYGTKIKDAPPIWADHLRDQKDKEKERHQQELQKRKEEQKRREELQKITEEYTRKQAIEEQQRRQRRQEAAVKRENRGKIASSISIFVSITCTIIFVIQYFSNDIPSLDKVICLSVAFVVSLICTLFGGDENASISCVLFWFICLLFLVPAYLLHNFA